MLPSVTLPPLPPHGGIFCPGLPLVPMPPPPRPEYGNSASIQDPGVRTATWLTCPQLLYHPQPHTGGCEGAGWMASGAGGRYPREL